MQTVSFRITGISPLLMNRFTDEAAKSVTERVSSTMVAKQKLTPQEECEKALYMEEGGEVIMPAENLMSCIIEAGKHFKAGKSKLTTLKTTMLTGCVFFNDMHFKLEYNEPWCVDSRSVVNPATGGRLIKHRPKFYDWSFAGTVEIDTQDISLDLVREVFDTAGRKIGLCDYRPQRKGPFGRFRVDEWELVSN